MSKTLVLPPPRAVKRGRKILVSFTAAEYGELEALAKQRDEPVATTAWVLVTAAIESQKEAGDRAMSPDAAQG